MVAVFLVRTRELEAQELEAEARRLVDRERLQKTERLKQHEDRLRCLACGLLLQYAVEHMYGENNTHPVSGWTCLSVQDLLEGISQRRDFQFHYGRWGKPYLTGGPFFSLSHSGEYAACAISEEEVGLDVQRMRKIPYDRLAQRFFPEREWKALLACEEAGRDELFYRLWTRKEAYGKFTGEGLKGSLGRSLLDSPGKKRKDSLGRSLSDSLGRSLLGNPGKSLKDSLDRSLPDSPGGMGPGAVYFEEYGSLPGYQACVCLKVEKGRGYLTKAVRQQNNIWFRWE